MGNHERGGRRSPRDCGGRHRAPTTSRLQPTQLVAVVVLAVVGFGGIGLGVRSPAEPPAPAAAQRGMLDAGSDGASSAGSQVGFRDGPALPRSAPVRLDIPSIAVHTRLVELGLNPDDTLEVPSEPLLAGWYTGSPTSGERGPSVIAGHVDSRETGPAVFYRLGQVETGARIDVTRVDGVTARFTVTAVRAYAKSDFPSQTVYGNTSRATLRLITCGDWNDESKEYDGNVVVFAELDAADS